MPFPRPVPGARAVPVMKLLLPTAPRCEQSWGFLPQPPQRSLNLPWKLPEGDGHQTGSSEPPFGQVTTCPDPSPCRSVPGAWQCWPVPRGPAVSHPQGLPLPRPSGSQPAAGASGSAGELGMDGEGGEEARNGVGAGEGELARHGTACHSTAAGLAARGGQGWDTREKVELSLRPGELV